MDNTNSAKINRIRQSLLDLSRRNPLINFQGDNQISLTLKAPIEEFLIRIKNKEFIYFTEDAEKNEGSRFLTQEVKTKEKLGKLYRKDWHFFEERGSHILFIAMGFLMWNEGEEVNLSPLALIPVIIHRPSVHGAYKIELGEDWKVNLPLIEKIKKSFEFNLEEVDSLEDYLALWEEKVKASPWQIVPEVVLSSFNYSSFVLYEDLNEERWMKKPSDHQFVSKLLNEGFFKSRLEDKDYLTLNRKELNCIVDADSSQLQALIKYKSGKNFIIQGPPGTGKTQTILNLIGQALIDNKTVLLVSDKKAALDVIYQRMKALNLDQLCLLLTGNDKLKKEVIIDLNDTLRRRIVFNDKVILNYQKVDGLDQTVDLNRKELTKKIKSTGLAVGEILVKLIQLRKDHPEFHYFLDNNMRDFNPEELEVRSQTLIQLKNFLLTNQLNSNQVLQQSKVLEVNPYLVQELQAQARSLKELIDQIPEIFIPFKDFATQLKKQELGLKLDMTPEKMVLFKNFLASVKKVNDNSLKNLLNYEIVKNYPWWKRVLPKNKKAINGFLESLSPENLFLLKELTILLVSKGEISLEDSLKDLYEKVDYYKQTFEEKDFISFPDKPGLPLFKRRLEEFCLTLKIGDEFSLENFKDFLNLIIENPESLYQQMEFNQVKNKITNLKLDHWLFLSQKTPFSLNSLEKWFEFNYLTFLSKDIFNQDYFNKFNYSFLKQEIEQFSKEDLIFMQNNRDQIKAIYDKQNYKILTSNLGLDEELQLLFKEAAKKHKQITVRKLFNRAGRLVQKIKPVMFMTPQSVAENLNPNKVSFDLVIFDEASQIRPAEALGAISRGKQVIVVGDSNQLPPTSFFENFNEQDDDLESILDWLESKGLEQITLNWHYRSLHHSLIRQSNESFYQNKLKMFPQVQNSSLGVELIKIQGEYDRSKSRTNYTEAQALVDKLKEVLVDYPNKTIAIVAINAPQMELIENLLEDQVLDKDLYKNILSQHKEKLIIKNLETIQGDERDIVLISLTYGPDKNGVFKREFGPILIKGGARRLNVLFSRAREKMLVFSSFDLKEDEDGSKNVQILQKFLDYFKNWSKEIVMDSSEDLLINHIKNLLEEKGFQVDILNKNISAGISMAVRKENIFVGLEIDFNLFQEFKQTKERELLRYQLLSKRNWKVVRTYLINWLRQPESELSRVISEIEKSN